MIGIALLGAGRMARVHAKAIAAAGGELVTVFDVVEPAAASLASESGASVAASAEKAFRHPGVAAVLVATSSDTHVKRLSRKHLCQQKRREKLGWAWLEEDQAPGLPRLIGRRCGSTTGT
jgi:3-hydroxyisobutyrate dehydrogenase-like beta-hydroxyacid dehydrogenase